MGLPLESSAIETPPRPIRRVDGYLPIEDHGLIGDGTTAALVGRDGAISWLCVPQFDDPPLFCGLLDHQRGGRFLVAPEDLETSRQFYVGDTGVLVTELNGRDSRIQVVDALGLRSGADLNEDAPAGRGELIRSIRVLRGPVTVAIDVDPRGGVDTDRHGDTLRMRTDQGRPLELVLQSDRALEGPRTRLELNTGDRVNLVLRWGAGTRRPSSHDAEAVIEATVDAWTRWIRNFRYEGAQTDLVRRSAITLKLLDHFANGAIVAAPTSSLPEAIGGPRNWDYRFAWIRDAAYSVYALRRIGMGGEAWGFLSWVLDAIDRDGHPRVLYDLDGRRPEDERVDPGLEGYRGSGPVRWGNAAADQHQHDVYGEILDCAFQWSQRGGPIDERFWERLVRLIEAARSAWRTPDQGIWEVRTSGRPFTYSAALCQVALDRGARMARRLGLPGDVDGWQADAERITAALLEEAWDPKQNSLTEHLGGEGGLDASLLSLPLRRCVPAHHPRMAATARAIQERLAAGNGLIYRYLPEESPDGLPGHEGAFLLCSFWMADNLALQGRRDEAHAWFDSLCARANPLGLLSEQVDPTTGAFLGNFPQAFSHVGLISTGVNLDRIEKGESL